MPEHRIREDQSTRYGVGKELRIGGDADLSGGCCKLVAWARGLDDERVDVIGFVSDTAGAVLGWLVRGVLV